jgi:hypothetical protein
LPWSAHLFLDRRVPIEKTSDFAHPLELRWIDGVDAAGTHTEAL